MVGEEKWSGRRNGWGGVAIAEAKCWEGGVVGKEEWSEHTEKEKQEVEVKKQQCRMWCKYSK